MWVLLGRARQKRSFSNILNRKGNFLEQESEVSKTSDKSNFSKALVHGFCQKIELFTMCVFFANKGKKDCFLIFWIENNTFQTRKVKFKKRQKNRNFQMGQSMFLSKNRAFYYFYQGRKDVFLIFLIEKNTFQTR